MLSQLLCAVARRVESHALLVCFLASGHSCSCLYNSSAWKARIKNTLFFPLTRLLFSIVLHLSHGKYRLEPRRLGRELNPDVPFAACCAERGKQCGRPRGERWASSSCPAARCAGCARAECLGQTWGTGLFLWGAELFMGCRAFRAPSAEPHRHRATERTLPAGPSCPGAGCLTPGHGPTTVPLFFLGKNEGREV